jgi:hypothetical protein
MPAVYLVNGNTAAQSSMTVNLSIDEAWKGHTGTLVGTLQESSLASWGHAPLQFTSVNNFSLNDTSSTGLAIPMTIANLPTTMDWFRGDAQWTVSLDDGRQFKLPGTTRLELFVIWDTPGSIYLPKGVWPEVLRKVFTYSSLDGASSKNKAIAKITSYLHGGTGLVYNVEGGGSPNYIDKPTGSILGGPFKLKSYLSDPAENPVNCYDQAGAIQTFAGAIGIQTQWIYSFPFGYIPGVSPDTGLQLPSTDLIGVGLTNNPFGTPLILNWNDIDRTFFVNHAFVMYNNQIYDACAGPHLGTEDLPTYLSMAIDGKSTDSPHYNWLYVQVPTPHSYWVGCGYNVLGVPGQTPSSPVATGVTGVE